MAAHHSSRKVRTYQSLYRLNRAFATVTRHCWLIERAGLMPIVQMRVFADLARELQAHISHAVVDRMHGIEDEDMFHFGKTRIRWEHHLNPERPPFNPHQ
jgi:hypothetical protein